MNYIRNFGLFKIPLKLSFNRKFNFLLGRYYRKARQNDLRIWSETNGIWVLKGNQIKWKKRWVPRREFRVLKKGKKFFRAFYWNNPFYFSLRLYSRTFSKHISLFYNLPISTCIQQQLLFFCTIKKFNLLYIYLMLRFKDWLYIILPKLNDIWLKPYLLNYNIIFKVQKINSFFSLSKITNSLTTIILSTEKNISFANNIKYKNINKTDTYYPYLTYIINRYITHLTSLKTIFFFIRSPLFLLKLPEHLIFLYFQRAIRFQRFPFKHIFWPLDFFGLIFFSLYWFDFSWLIERLQQILTKLSIFKHKRFWRYFFKLTFRYIYKPLSQTRIKGIYISIRGKIGVVGNSRKRRYFIRMGKPSVSDFRLKIAHQTARFITTTGAIGFSIYVVHL